MSINYFEGKFTTMGAGEKIRKLRELKNYTQAYMSEKLNLSLSGYGKIERDEIDITLSRLQKIAEILGTDFNTILSFDEKNIFNFSNNHNANGIVQTQYLNDGEIWQKLLDQMKSENLYLKKIIEQLMEPSDKTAYDQSAKNA